MTHQFHKVDTPLKTNHFKVCVPDRPDLTEFSRHVQYIDVTEHDGAGADIIVGLVHPIKYPELPRAIKEGNITFIQLEIYDPEGDDLIYTMQFEKCKLVKVHRRFDYFINKAVVIEYTFHAEEVDVMVLAEKDNVDRSNWSDTDASDKRNDRNTKHNHRNKK